LPTPPPPTTCHPFLPSLVNKLKLLEVSQLKLTPTVFPISLTSASATFNLPRNNTQFSQSLLTGEKEFFEESEVDVLADLDIFLPLRTFLFDHASSKF